MKEVLLLIGFFIFSIYGIAQERERPYLSYKNRVLVNHPDSLGNEIPDYSYCGYKMSNETIPNNIPARVSVPLVEGDATALIQRAIDYVASLPAGEKGVKGAVCFKPGEYILSGRLTIRSSGVVLQGGGVGGACTVLKATGISRSPLIRVIGKDDKVFSAPFRISESYIPVNSKMIHFEDTESLHPGSRVYVHRPSTKKWIQELKMNEFGGETDWLGWKPRERDIYWDRTIREIIGNKIILDAPLTNSIDTAYGGGFVIPYKWEGRISNIGVENLIIESEYDASNPKDEDHCWFGITMENVENAWVRQVEFRHLAGSAVALYESVSKVTVEDCISVSPVSEIGGQRRNTFFTMGQQTLFQRCYAENGCHDFATGFMATGPNAFVQCESSLPNNFSGAIDSWANGVLFDIVNVDGNALKFTNRGQDGQGAGWAAANSMFWQCSASRIECFKPPTAQNYAYGTWAQFAGDGLWYEANSHIKPRSLFYAQLAQRKGVGFYDYKGEYLPFEGESTSSPTIVQAIEFTKKSVKPPIILKDYINEASSRGLIVAVGGSPISASDIPVMRKSPKSPVIRIEIKKGKLVRGGIILVGDRLNVPWWRGDSRPYEAAKANPAITRFVPGRVGLGYTDELKNFPGLMSNLNILAINHNYGLWYDRRRDDHERVRRMDGEVWPPFYEQPFARSGQGIAWDGLSKYDLNKYNHWYWGRLKQFASNAEDKGVVLIHQNYFQHNILEAGAHWADSPWRPANNINNTGFPEPPPYAGDKRIYLAGQFYDINHQVRRELHRKYIRHCLENFKGNSNVIQSISAEFTGPLHFVEFWLDVVAEWEGETGENALVALSTTKDVQDAILADPERAKVVDIIDICYWSYRADGSLYAPPGGVNMSPRQHARKVKPGSRSFEQVYKAVSEYRTKYPRKAVVYSEGDYTAFGWAVFMAGGSMPTLNKNLPSQFLKDAASMKPVDKKGSKVYALCNQDKEMILYVNNRDNVDIDLSGANGGFNISFIDPQTGGETCSSRIITGGKKQKIKLPSKNNIVIWISKN